MAAAAQVTPHRIQAHEKGQRVRRPPILWYVFTMNTSTDVDVEQWSENRSILLYLGSLSGLSTIESQLCIDQYIWSCCWSLAATSDVDAEYDETLTEEEKAIGRFQKQRLKQARKRAPRVLSK
jgi:hypothetical protein